jgi:hypothetical protein
MAFRVWAAQLRNAQVIGPHNFSSSFRLTNANAGVKVWM